MHYKLVFTILELTMKCEVRDPENITPVSSKDIGAMRRYVSKAISMTDSKGRHDIATLLDNTAYCMGEGSVIMLTLMFQERLKLAVLEYLLRNAQRNKYMASMNMKYGIGLMDKGEPAARKMNVAELKQKIKRVERFIEFLDPSLKRILSYPKDADYLISKSKPGREIGEILYINS